MSSASERRARRLEIQQNSGNSMKWEKVLDVPEDIPMLKFEVMQPVVFDIMPTIIDAKHPDHSAIKAFADKYEDERIEDWCVPFSIHKGLQGVSQHVCRNWGKIGDRKCPTCEIRDIMTKEEGKDPKSSEVKAYNVSQRVALCVCMVGGEDDGMMKLIEGSRGWIYDPIKALADREGIYLADITKEGYSIKATPQAFSFTNSKTGKKETIGGELFVELVPREFGYTEEDLADVIPICDYLNFKSYDEIFEMVHGLASSNDEDTETTTATSTPAPSVREPNSNSRRGRGRVAETSEAPSATPPLEEATVTESPRRGRRGRTAETTTDSAEDNITF